MPSLVSQMLFLQMVCLVQSYYYSLGGWDAASHSLQDLSSSTKNWTSGHSSGNAKSWPLDLQGTSSYYFFKKLCCTYSYLPLFILYFCLASFLLFFISLARGPPTLVLFIFSVIFCGYYSLWFLHLSLLIPSLFGEFLLLHFSYLL